MSRPGDEDRVQVPAHDHAIHVRVDEIQPGRGSPMAQQAGLDVGERQRLAQQRVVKKVDLPDGQVVGGAPPGVDSLEVAGFRRHGCHFHRRPRSEPVVPVAGETTELRDPTADLSETSAMNISF
jgi:hypothetical protein